MSEFDAVVVGAGPNGLTAAARLARAGWHVLVLERDDRIGGGARTAAFAESRAVYDICSAAHPFGIASPAFAELGLATYGLEWRQPPIPMAHPLDDGSAAVLHRDVADTAAGLGQDAGAYRSLVAPLVERWDEVAESFLAPLVPWPRHPLDDGPVRRRRIAVGVAPGPPSSASLGAGPCSPAWPPTRSCR